jgi:hypothetical protein
MMGLIQEEFRLPLVPMSAKNRALSQIDPHSMRSACVMTKIIIAGAKGRMGQALLRCAETIPAITVSGRIDLGDDLGAVIGQGDVVIDFTFHESTLAFARLCAARQKAIVIGTTGHSEAERKELASLATQIPMVWSANYSTGVNALFWLTRKAAEILGPGFDLEIVEMHHRLKKTPPAAPPPRWRKSWPKRAISHWNKPPAMAATAWWASGRRRKSASTPFAAATWWATTPSFSRRRASGWN